MLFQYQLATYTLPFSGFSVKLQAATNFEALVDKMFGGDTFAETHCPYGAALWPAAVALGHVLCARPELVRGKRVLDLGSGLGLTALVAKKLGADVTASDFHPDMGELCAINAKLNQVELPFVSFDWRDESYQERFDTLVGSDLLYDNTLTPLVLAVAQRLL